MNFWARAETACPQERDAVQRCRESLGLMDPRACYPPEYDGRCGDLELKLKRCLSYAVCSRKDAALVFDGKAKDRAERVEANKRLQACLVQKKALLPCR